VQPMAAPVVAEAQPEVVAAAPHQAPAATEAQVEAPVEAAQAPAPASGPRAEVVEVPNDDSPPPGWDQWASFPTRSPEPQEGALVRRHEGHMVAGGPRTRRRGLVLPRRPPRPGGGGRRRSPCVCRRQGEQELWGELRSHGATLNRALNEALQVHGGPAWRVFQVGHGCLFFFHLSFSRAASVSQRLWVLICGC
jgi:hypothetical protein